MYNFITALERSHAVRKHIPRISRNEERRHGDSSPGRWPGQAPRVIQVSSDDGGKAHNADDHLIATLYKQDLSS